MHSHRFQLIYDKYRFRCFSTQRFSVKKEAGPPDLYLAVKLELLHKATEGLHAGYSVKTKGLFMLEEKEQTGERYFNGERMDDKEVEGVVGSIDLNLSTEPCILRFQHAFATKFYPGKSFVICEKFVKIATISGPKSLYLVRTSGSKAQFTIRLDFTIVKLGNRSVHCISARHGQQLLFSGSSTTS